jgi:predicted GNAT family acetyltransferase
MSSTPSNPEVRHNPASSRYETEVDGHLAVVDYTLEGDRMTLTRTFVPPELRGRGVAELLVRAALETARAKGLRIVPQCSYVARFIERNAGYQTLLVG